MRIMALLRLGVISCSLVSLMATTCLAAPPKVNLLRHEAIALDRNLSAGIDFNKEPAIRDGDEASVAPIKPRSTNPVELVFTFDGQIVSPDKLRLKVTGAKKDQAKIEILASTVSATSGFTSLRTEPIRNTESWQNIDFEQTAAKWIIIKIIPFDKDASLSIAEIDLQGHVGAPVTVYKFNESPADALSLLSGLESTIDLSITGAEASLFKDAADGSLDDWTLAEASLLSSGIYDASARKLLLTEIDAMEAAMRKSVPQHGDSFAIGRALLEWLHANPMKAGYIEGQTDVSKILSGQTYNCVSSATLYNILARRIGLDARGIEVPDHAFSILYDGTDHADVETTTKAGFNPARNKAGLTDFAKKTGFVYINDKNRNKRREIGDAGMVALTYYNHGVGYSKNGEYQKALLSYFRALSLDPASKSSVKNALSALSNWSVDLIKKDQIDDALKILDMGLSLAPKDRNLRHNLKAVWQQKVNKEVNSGNAEQALTALRKAYVKTRDKSFIRLQSWVFQSQGQKLTNAGDWEGALRLAQIGLTRVDKEAQRDLKKYRAGIILNWSSSAVDAQNWNQAVDVLERGLAFDGSNYKIKNNLAYAAQEWVAFVGENEGDTAKTTLVMALAKRFPDIRNLQRVVSQSFDKDATLAREAGDFETALLLYAKAREQRPDDRLLRKNAQVTWDMWAKLSMKDKDWATALDIYERALVADPSASLFNQNITYVVQEWSRGVAKSDGSVKAEKLVESLAERFPKNSKISRMRGQIVGRDISALAKAHKYEEAAASLPGAESFFASKSRFDNLTLNIYYNWAQEFDKKRKWQAVIDIYAAGHAGHPKNSKLKRNLVATWHKWAKTYMDNGEWQEAIDVYERGLTAVPSTNLFRQNIKYCRSKL
jgi:tetratricopeptide (TPR) repeat protein